MRTPTQPTTTSRREILRTSAAIAVVLVLLIPLAGLHADGEPAALATIAQRERAVLEAATADFGRLNGNAPSETIERTFNGDTRVNGERVAYETWPLLENPWMRQEFGGNLTLTDGRTTRLYDVQNWTITENVQP